tara:strand:- start:492 stop:878 length:387 start_codon:yes stop_codon:yes gene_type:complete
MKFHHIGYLTNNLKSTINEFKKINYAKKTNIINDNLLKVKVVFIKNTNNLIELVKPYKKNYGLIKIIKNKNYAYHFAYKVKNINKSIKKLKKMKFKIIVNPVPAKAFKNKKISFLKMKDGFIIELIES